MDLSDDRIVDDQIRKLVSDSVPLPVERRLRSQLADFRSRLSTPEPVVARHAPGRAPAAWWGLGATCAVVVVLVAVAVLVLRPQTSFAEVAMAVLGQPWVHVRTVHADQSVSEAWFSPAKDISASRWRGSAKYEDYRLRVYYSYNPAEQVLYRGPVVSRTSQASEFESMVDELKILLQGSGPPDEPLAHLGFLGAERGNMKVHDQRVEKVAEQNHTWLEYRITVKYSESTEPVRMLFRVDASTKLPQMCRTERHQDGKPATLEIQFDYPGKGPADIYDLGVPKTTKLVDRVPAGDLKRIAAALQAGRERMDDYRAVFVAQDDGFNYAWWTKFPEVFYRKSDRYRRDSVVGGPNDRGTLQQPAADVDLRKWWFERARLFRFSPIYVQLGPTSYTCTRRTVIDPDGSRHSEIASVQKYVYNLMAGEMFPVDYAMRPEFACRPPMGLGDEHQEPTLDMQPAEGPAGCILLNVRHTTKEGRVNEKGVGLADVNRFWLDPERDYIAMRWEMVTADGTGKETVISNHTVEETARSPQGVWYATKIRLKNAVREGNGKRSDQIYHIYVDFDAVLPDALFEVPGARRIE